MAHASVYVTCPDEDSAARIARALLERRLVACANIVPGVRSLYAWEGRIEDEREVVMFLKTRRALVPQVVQAVVAAHPYELPCAVALDVAGGHVPYLAYVDEVTNGPPDAR